MLHMPCPMLLAPAAFIAPPGQTLFQADAEPGLTTTWVVPAGVFSVCAVAIGAGGLGVDDGDRRYGGPGGGLAYVNGIAVTPGETLTVKVAPGFQGTTRLSRGGTVLCEATAGHYITPGVAVVGTGFTGGYSDYVTNSNNYAYGGGAATWFGNGPSASYGTEGFIGGQGTSPLGSGAGYNPAGYGSGRAYGGGSAIRGNGDIGGFYRGAGCLRILWGAGRAYPNTNTGDV
ncbi:hypothetical protein [uncultured Brevundimonas sp.]|uniref:hypothetical protein n=1 Tax=uncultured Brevundimonas sp. TaxID=213418 RepID=UPI0025DB1FD4|nr:hypothetical protein [uncultured Brevundimonas sp.]